MNIVDVDFRYVKRSAPAHELGEGIGRMTPVLQWRKKLPKQDSMRVAFGVGMVFTEFEWTDWQDVRTEEE